MPDIMPFCMILAVITHIPGNTRIILSKLSINKYTSNQEISWHREVMQASVFRQICLLLLLLWAMPALVAAAAADDDLYRQALQLTKQEQHAKASVVFKQLVSQSPDNLNYRYDYILTLGWSGKNREVLTVSAKLDPEKTPSYVLEIIGKSARNEQDYELAEKMYRLALRKDPHRLHSQLGLAYVLHERGRAEESMTILLSLAERNPGHIDTLEALAIVHQHNKDYYRSLSLYQKILTLKPQHRGAKQGLVQVIAQLGAPHVAMEVIEKNPGLVNDNELARIRQDRAATSIRWGRLYKPADDARYDDTDAGLKELQALLDQLNEKGEMNSVRVHRIKTNMLVGLFDRHRTKECVALYESLQEESAVIADYGLMASARAYQAEGRAEKARDIYLQILQHKPDDFEARLGLFYAYMEIPDYEQARTLVNDMVASEAEWTGGKDSRHRQQNPNRVTAEVARALALAWTDNLDEAQRSFDALVNEAPFNAGLRANRGYSYLWRGWPKRALQEFQLAHDIDSEDLTSAAGKFEALLDGRDYERAESVLQQLLRDYPDEAAVARQQKTWGVHNKREFYLDMSGSNSSPGQPDSRSLKLDALQYSSPLDHNYRVFAHEVGEYGKFDEGSETYWRFGGGIEYRSPNWQAQGEISTGPGDYSELGLAVAASWTPDDYWTAVLAMNSYSNDIPLRGRLNEGVEGSDIKLDVAYRFHESRTLSAGVQAIDMSDGNERFSMYAGLFQRLKSTATYKLDGNLALYGSNNSRINAPYFNPESDFSASASLINEWLLSRNKQRDFLHRLGFGFGVYDQQGFGSDGLWSISYEQEWVIGDELVLRYGLAHSEHPYDGVQDSEDRLTLMMDWRF